MLITRCLPHKHFRSAHLLAMCSVNLMSAIWSGILLWKDQALIEAGAHFEWFTDLADEDYAAAVLMFFAIIQTVWLVMRWKPLRWGRIPYGSVGYAVMLFWWSFALLNNILTVRPIHPTATAALTVVALLCVFAFAGVPRSHDADAGN